ncbi:hypothetical protein A3A40_01535 [Candidatus Kaiserbacteria bacterium RIFCSPLOWO2_01_FULL_54_20]|uniref:Methyltransferase domain-containing protein n=1 Tax=Candidatus Kaiserbacteria bacterium RIFCSPLOWO2_01_FULL_54_20 TaxID=1798513 RepID=A0A1F6EJG6_9BACT|nr:MAG: hypothetical protein A3A40_01535 [Candidatus Kaiserbacteria bacterium RIFCSPLOWO2_01_FULL_54_20]
MTTFTPISLNDLPAHSPWPARLLGLEPWKNVKRDNMKIDEEYVRGNYTRCLELYERARGAVSIEDLRAIEFGSDDPTVVVSHGDELALAKLSDAYEEYYRLIERSIAPHVEDGDTLVELGCGYGYNLALLKKRLATSLAFRGGEYARTAVALAGTLFKDDDIRVEQFDFYSLNYPVIEQASAPVVIFTAYAVEQIPDITNMFDVLSKNRSKIKAVIHVEPIYEFQATGLLGLLRRRYIEVCDYNRNLYTELHRRSDIKIDVCEQNIFGINGLHPASVISWHFVS